MAEHQMIKPEEYPDNSHKAKRGEKEIVRAEKIVKGKVKKRKKSVGNRLAENLELEEPRGVLHDIIYDILIPAAKDLVSDMLTGGIEMILFGKEGGRDDRRTTRDRGRSYVSYGNYYGSKRNKRDGYSRINRAAAHTFDDLIFDNRQEAEDVLTHMVDILDEYQEIKVADLYDLVGETSTFTDYKWGWENLSSASVARVRDGYKLKLPKAVPLD